MVLCAKSFLLPVCPVYAWPTRLTGAYTSTPHEVNATSELWFPAHEHPEQASAFMEGGKPTFPLEVRAPKISRTPNLRVGGCVDLVGIT